MCCSEGTVVERSACAFARIASLADDEHLGLAVADDELPLLGVLRLVHRHERGAEPVAGVGGDGPLDAVVGDDGDAVAALRRRATRARRGSGRPARRTRA